MGHSLDGLKPRRTLLHVKAEDIAARIGVSTESFYRLERGTRRCYLDKAIVMAGILECSVDELTREPTMDERKDLFERGERKRELQARSNGDDGVAAALEEFEHLGGDHGE